MDAKALENAEEDQRIQDELRLKPAGYEIRGLDEYYERHPERDPDRDIKEMLAKKFPGKDLKKMYARFKELAAVRGGKRRSRKQNTKKRQQRRRKSRRSQ
jgi:hypothetical protein